VLGAVGWAAYGHRTDMQRTAGAISQATLWWLIPAALMIGAVYLCRALASPPRAAAVSSRSKNYVGARDEQ
jgi:hypothetical protein